MKNLWESISAIGTSADQSHQDVKKIRLLNQMAGLAIVLQLLGLITLPFSYSSVILLSCIFSSLVFLGVIILQHYKLYLFARAVQTIFAILIITAFNYLFGPLLNAIVAFVAMGPVILIFFQSLRARILLNLFLILAFSFCTYMNFYWQAPFEVLVLPAVYYYVFIIIYFAVLIIINFFQSESNIREQQLKESLAQLKIKNEELEKLAYIASHDLKTPIRNISSYLTLIQQRIKGTPTAEQIDEFLDTAINSSKQMYRTIEDVLVFSKIRDLEEDKTLIDLNEVLQTVLFNLQTFIDQKKAQVHIENFPIIFGNFAQMVSLFQNLLENGLKYNNSSPPILSFEYIEKPDHYLFRVKDNGIGIAPNHQEQIFDIFKRLHADHVYEGTGVGLAICKKIAEQHQGDIWVEENPDGGSIFLIKLPILKPHDQG
ncbi:MAG: ATP-binding protein [Saprospiraceae bacterium]|nr:ATP-binding protein [Saprospiraceae bacterium]